MMVSSFVHVVVGLLLLVSQSHASESEGQSSEAGEQSSLNSPLKDMPEGRMCLRYDILDYKTGNPEESRDWTSFKLDGCDSVFLPKLPLKDDGALALGEALSNAAADSLVLEAINLHDAGITALGMEVLSEGIATLGNKLKALMLGKNELGNEGVRSLANALKKHPKLEALDLSRVAMDAAGVHDLLLIIARHPNLQSLLLDRNDLGDAGAEAVANALGVNRVLTNLSMMSAGVTDVGAQKLLRALREGGARLLENLDLRGNDDVAAETLEQIQAVLAARAPKQEEAAAVKDEV